MPDILLAPVKVEVQETDGSIVSEAQLEGHLENGDTKSSRIESDTAQLVKDDYALSEALNLLKGLAILKK